MPFFVYVFQFPILSELYDWVMLTGWAAVLLILSVIAFFFVGTFFVRNAWWQYVVLLLMGGLGIWSLVVAYNSYQQWLSLNGRLPEHGVFVGLKVIRTQYLAAIQTCQFQFVLTTSVLIVLIGVAFWQLLRSFLKRPTLKHLVSNRRVRLWVSSIFIVIGLCCLIVGVLLITKLYLPLIYAPQINPFQFNEPTVLELIGLFIVSLGGPLILLLVSATGFADIRLPPGR